MAQTAEDCAILLNAMAGFDPKDSTSFEREKEDYTRDLDKPLKGVKSACPKNTSAKATAPMFRRHCKTPLIC
ncbi:aspartyl/glutamyl-tRNA amidotransferase subunit A [Neisseria gonorrhoeae]|uniref:Aspartyl/glutamyl-tRNA amidotransferase subunit A n=1 Tax=Neisseria gonorrhoeae TaxID=485 RepID=A0A378VXZ4_NEIGO|nr:aspartyl/glutamyl-tRNA amidotransferase subunit A [Neisseria gonorrhoeae]